MIFFVGLHQPSDCKHFKNSFVSVNRLWKRKSAFEVKNWVLDSGAFSQIFKYGGFEKSEIDYANEILRWKDNGNLLAAVSQDYLCEPEILDKTGMSVFEHQQKTLERYLRIKSLVNEKVYIMPVLQGYMPKEYLNHLEMYGNLLKKNQWVGVGSLVKRSNSPQMVWWIISEIKKKRPDLKIHGFGLKFSSLNYKPLKNLLYSSDSMAWSFAARKSGENPNDWREARKFEEKINQEKIIEKFFWKN